MCIIFLTFDYFLIILIKNCFLDWVLNFPGVWFISSAFTHMSSWLSTCIFWLILSQKYSFNFSVWPVCGIFSECSQFCCLWTHHCILGWNKVLASEFLFFIWNYRPVVGTLFSVKCLCRMWWDETFWLKQGGQRAGQIPPSSSFCSF